MNGGAVVCAMMGLDNVTNEIMIQDVFFGVDFVVFWHAFSFQHPRVNGFYEKHA